MAVAPLVTEVLGRHAVKPAFFRKLTELDVHKKVNHPGFRGGHSV